MRIAETIIEEQAAIYSIGKANYNISRWYIKERSLNEVVTEEITSETLESHN